MKLVFTCIAWLGMAYAAWWIGRSSGKVRMSIPPPPAPIIRAEEPGIVYVPVPTDKSKLVICTFEPCNLTGEWGPVTVIGDVTLSNVSVTGKDYGIIVSGNGVLKGSGVNISGFEKDGIMFEDFKIAGAK